MDTGIATNLADNHVRRRSREDAAAGRLATADRADGHESRVVDRVDAQGRAAQLTVAIAALPAADRDVLLLSSWAGLTNQEIADALAYPPGPSGPGSIGSGATCARPHRRSLSTWRPAM